RTDISLREWKRMTCGDDFLPPSLTFLPYLRGCPAFLQVSWHNPRSLNRRLRFPSWEWLISACRRAPPPAFSLPASETAPPLDDPSTKEVSAGLPALKLLLGGPVFLFGEVTGSEQAARSTDATKVVGVTGLSWTLPVENLAELQLSCGPLLTYASQPAATHDRSSALPIQADPLRIAFQCRWPLLAGVKLESQSVATPAFSDQERDTMSQDLRV